MQHLQGETLKLVLSYLSHAEDFVRCSVVNRAWAEASTLTQIRVLAVQHYEEEELSKSLSIIRWLQGLHQRGCLKNLQEASLDVVVPREDPLAQGFMTLAGSCRLKKCSLSGQFCLATALGLLPTSLLSLELYPDVGPQVIRLSSFGRFTALKFLKLDVEVTDENDSSEVNMVNNRESVFEIDTSFPCLQASCPRLPIGTWL